MQDNLANIRQLPAKIIKQLNKLIVNRIGSKPEAYMITKDIIGHVAPQACYQLVFQKSQLTLQLIENNEFVMPLLQATTPPPSTTLTGQWHHEKCVFIEEANILGGMGIFQLDRHHDIKIPIIDANAKDLAFYNAHFLSEGSLVRFETSHSLPLTDVSIGKDYVQHYLIQKEHGGGEYIEYHDQPHLWLPKSKDCHGHILLGKQVNDQYYFTGFRIPFGHAVYLSPNALHADAYLIGDYLVVYTVTENYSTVLFKHDIQEKLEFFEPA